MTGASKTVGIIGVGSMGGNIASRLHESGYSLILYNKDPAAYNPFKGKERVALSESLDDFASKLKGSEKSAIAWMMVPGGPVTNEVVLKLSSLMRKGDIVIDASNSDYSDSISNHKVMAKGGISYLDVGCAGGPDDLLRGVALYVGGAKSAYKKAEDVFKVVSGAGSYGYVGGPGAGQLVKFVHNGMFYVQFPVASEAVAGMIAMGNANPDMDLDVNEAVRLMSVSPPITTGIMQAIGKALKDGVPADAPEMTISSMVKNGVKRAESNGADLTLMKVVLEKYGSLAKETRRIYSAAKKILTGH